MPFRGDPLVDMDPCAPLKTPLLNDPLGVSGVGGFVREETRRVAPLDLFKDISSLVFNPLEGPERTKGLFLRKRDGRVE